MFPFSEMPQNRPTPARVIFLQAWRYTSHASVDITWWLDRSVPSCNYAQSVMTLNIIWRCLVFGHDKLTIVSIEHNCRLKKKVETYFSKSSLNSCTCILPKPESRGSRVGGGVPLQQYAWCPSLQLPHCMLRRIESAGQELSHTNSADA